MSIEKLKKIHVRNMLRRMKKIMHGETNVLWFERFCGCCGRDFNPKLKKDWPGCTLKYCSTQCKLNGPVYASSKDRKRASAYNAPRRDNIMSGRERSQLKQLFEFVGERNFPTNDAMRCWRMRWKKKATALLQQFEALSVAQSFGNGRWKLLNLEKLKLLMEEKQHA